MKNITDKNPDCKLIFVAHNGKTFDHPILQNFLGISGQNLPKINCCETIWLGSLKLLKISSGKGGSLESLASQCMVSFGDNEFHRAEQDVLTLTHIMKETIQNYLIPEKDGDWETFFYKWAKGDLISPLK